MKSENLLRLLLFVSVGTIHIILLLFFAINIATVPVEITENARVMKLTDFSEFIPEPPPPPPPPPAKIEEQTAVESIAEIMIETDTVPDQIIVAPGTLTEPYTGTPTWDDYLPIHLVSNPPVFDEREIRSSIVYPPIAQRSGIEGRVILELFVDKNGMVQQVIVLQENPQDRGFAEAAVRAFTGKKGQPAMANGEAVSARYRYPVTFKIN
ncbi:MAG: energy transducer TonB [Treponema sp.]|nr:energy transducer TonB [Treponema sp.]